MSVDHLSEMKRTIVLEKIPVIVNLIIYVKKKKEEKKKIHHALGHQAQK